MKLTYDYNHKPKFFTKERSMLLKIIAICTLIVSLSTYINSIIY